MKERFFTVYPKLVERFNRAAPLSVYFVIGPSIYIASASGNTITYQGLWSLEHPQDYDVVVHELMHVVQSYVSSPGWLQEGIADYARYHYGVNNDAAGWHSRCHYRELLHRWLWSDRTLSRLGGSALQGGARQCTRCGHTLRHL